MRIVFIENYKPYQFEDKFEQLLIHKPVLDRLGIEIVSLIKEADVVICCEVTSEIYHSAKGKTVIVCERYDASTLSYSRDHIQNKLVTAIFKEFVLLDYTKQNTETFKKRHHYWILNQIYNIDKNDPKHEFVTEKESTKIRCVPWNWKQYSHVSEKSDMNIWANLFDAKVERHIDVFYIVHPHKDNPILHRHRHEGLTALLKGDFTMVSEKVDKRNFLTTMRRCKIVVAPWGIGERIASDQFAILSGAVLVKPDTGFMVTHPNIYDERYYYPCSPDWSDVVDTVERVLQNYEEAVQKTMLARKLLISHNTESIVSYFYKNVISAFENKNK
jgi:hypothetical protein